MLIWVNGEEKTLADGLTVGRLLADMGLGQAFLAVAVNQAVVPRAQWGERLLQEGDRVEVLAPMAGG